MNSINNIIMKLADDFTIYCGHGPKTNIKYERFNNPFINISKL